MEGQATSTLTADVVRAILRDELATLSESQSERDYSIAGRLDSLDGSVMQLSQDVQGAQPVEGAVYEVRATGSQVETAKQALSVLCTEGLVLIVVMSINVGLLGWRAFTSRWLANG